MKGSRVLEGIRITLESKFNFLIFLSASILTFALIISVPYYSFVIRNLTDYRYNLDNLGYDLMINLYLTSGTLGLALTVLFALLTGILSTNIYVDVKRSGLGSGGYITSTLPGFIAGGCAACGASLLPLLGVGAAGILFPFSGNLWRLLSLIILLFTLGKMNEENICEI